MNSLTKESVGEAVGEREWDSPRWIPPKTAEGDYGYVANEETVSCSREELISKVALHGGTVIKFVWTPETPQPVFPEKVSLLVDAFKKRAVREAWQSIFWGVGFLAFGVVLAIALADWQFLYRNLLAVFGAVAVIDGVWELRNARHFTREDAESIASSARFAKWLDTKGISVYTTAIAACLLTVGVTQVITGDNQSIEAAGLVKPAVWQGQAWRLFTATLMHGSVAHFVMNFLALLQFARIVEQTINQAYLPLVFLTSAVCGSILSLLLYPNATSVGASGGLMGLLGFMTVAANVYSERYPPKYLRRLIEAIGFVAVLGIVGFAFIDNAAHLGGLGCGLLLGWVVLKREETMFAKTIKRRLSLLAILSLILIGIIAVIALRHMIK